MRGPAGRVKTHHCIIDRIDLTHFDLAVFTVVIFFSDVDTDGLDTDQNTVEEVIEFFVKEEQTTIE